MTLERIPDGADPFLDALGELLEAHTDCDYPVTIEWREDESRWFMQHGAAELFVQCHPEPADARVMFEAWMRVQPHGRA